MPIDPRFKLQGLGLRRDIRPTTVKLAEWLKRTDSFQMVIGIACVLFIAPPAPDADFTAIWPFMDILAIFIGLYIYWFLHILPTLPLKLPAFATIKDKNNPSPGSSGPGKADGILFLGNVRDGPTKGDELWITNSDARTHILFLGTTGAGKTEGLKALATNALCWGSGFVYVDGKAQTSVWGDLYSLARRFGRDDDLLVLNYMTGNADGGTQSNSLNPFSMGSASYLTQMMVGLMDDSGDDNAMWKGRAISLLSALMPALTWKRDNQAMLMDVGVIRDHLGLPQIIKLSRDPSLPDRIIRGLQSYLDNLPGYVDSAFDDDGNERPQTPDQPMVDLSQTRQQHGYLTMQFTRSLSSLADEYGYIFKQQLADIDMMDVVLNRRMLVVLIPALEKSPDEAANLGKIVVAALKGMMGATLGADLEGDKSLIIDNNPTLSDSPFLTIFDEVGYYTSPGMGVMAAQARSLGFCLVFAGQDMPGLQKRVKEEALSIVGNCNLKIFGKLEDPTETKDFFEKTISSAMVSEVSGFSATQGINGKVYNESDNISFQAKKEASYDDLRRQREGQVHLLWADKVVAANFLNAPAPSVMAIRVQRFLGVSPKNWSVEAREKTIAEVINYFKSGTRPDQGATNAGAVAQEITWMQEGMQALQNNKDSGATCAAAAVGNIITGLKRRSMDVLPANLAAPAVAVGGQQQWPFAGNEGVPASVPPPPFMTAGGVGGGVASSSSPSWMTGGTPPQQQGMPHAASASAPAWMSPASGGAPQTNASAQAGQAGGYPPAGASANPPPWMGGGAATSSASAPPSWATGAQQSGVRATGAPPPPWTAPNTQINPQQAQQGGYAGGYPQTPPSPYSPPPLGQPQQSSAPLPPWMGGAPATPPPGQPYPTQQNAAQQNAWAGGTGGAGRAGAYPASPPMIGQPPYAPPQQNQAQGWGNFAASPQSAGVPPQFVQSPPIPPSAPWMMPPPAHNVPPYGQQAYPPASQPMPPIVSPPVGAPPQSSYYGQPPQAGQPMPYGNPVQPNSAMLPVQQQSVPMAPFIPVTAPQTMPLPVEPQSTDNQAEDYLKNAAGNLSAEMFGSEKEEDSEGGDSPDREK